MIEKTEAQVSFIYFCPSSPNCSVLFKLDFLCSSSAFRILLESDEDRLLVVFNRGLILMTEVNILMPLTMNVSRLNTLSRTLVLVYKECPVNCL